MYMLYIQSALFKLLNPFVIYIPNCSNVMKLYILPTRCSYKFCVIF